MPFGGRSLLRVYDVSGRVRRRLWDGPVSPGAHVLRWSAADLEPGVYVMGLETPRGRLVRKFAVLR